MRDFDSRASNWRVGSSPTTAVLHIFTTGRKKIMTEEIIIKCIEYASQCGDTELVLELTDILNAFRNSKEEKKHNTQNHSVVVQLNPTTDETIARYNTVKEAYAALRKKDGDEI